MHTWAAQATAHASLNSGFGVGPMPAFGSASLYGFALGASATVLALVIMRSPRQPNLPGRLSDLWRRFARLAGARKWRAGRSPLPLNARSRIRRRVDLILLRMLGDEQEHSPSCGSAADEPIPEADPARIAPARGRRSKHAPRHAAPPAANTARRTKGRQPAAEPGQSSPTAS